MPSIWNNIGGIASNFFNTIGNNLASVVGGGSLGDANKAASVAAQQAKDVQGRAQAAGVNTGPLPQATQENLAGEYPNGNVQMGGSQPGTYIPYKQVTPSLAGTSNIAQSTSAPQNNNAPQSIPVAPIISPNTTPTNPQSIQNGVTPPNPNATIPTPTPTPQGGVLPNVNTTDPNSRSAQINALTQNLAAGGQGTPQETQLANEIAAQQQGLGDTLSNNILTSGDEGILTGRNAAANAQYGGRINNMTALLAGLQGQRAQNITADTAALSGAENNIPATQVLNPAQTLVSPFGGGNVASGGGGTTNATVQSLAQQVANGQMSEEQAQSLLPDSALSGALNQAIIGINPNFSASQSNANAQVQGTLPPAAAAASSQLTNLQNALQNAPGLEKTSIPLVNSLAAVASGITGIGGGGTQGLQSALTDARAAMANALGAANNSTPTTYDSYVKTLLPDGITEAQLTNAISQFQSQVQAKEGAYGNPGAVSPQSGQTTNSGNAISAGGYNFVKNAQGQWVAQ